MSHWYRPSKGDRLLRIDPGNTSGFGQLAFDDENELVENFGGNWDTSPDTTPPISPTPSTMGDQNQERPMMEYFAPIADRPPTCIVLPAITTTRFHLKSSSLG